MKKIKNIGFGWSDKECWGVWTTEKNAHLYLIINDELISDMKLTMVLDSFCPEGFQSTDILVNDMMVGKLKFNDSSPKEYHIIIPKKIIKKGGLLHLRFIIQKPGSPKQYGISEDPRMLGIAMHWIKIESIRNDFER